jgi:hypothetical protein
LRRFAILLQIYIDGFSFPCDLEACMCQVFYDDSHLNTIVYCVPLMY